MVTNIVMPNLGFDAQTGRLIEWLKQPGDYVEKGEMLALIESDKANVELECVSNGTIIELCYVEGDEIPIGDIIARIAASNESSTIIEATQTELTPTMITPLASRMLKEHDVNLQQVTGSGPRGRITKNDVENYISKRDFISETGSQSNSHEVLALPKVRRMAREAGINLRDVMQAGYNNPISVRDLQAFQQTDQPPTGAKLIKQSPIQKRTAERVSKSKQDAPHFYVSGEFDLENAIKYIKTVPDKLGLNDLIQYLIVQTTQRVPQINARYENGELYQYSSINLSIAVALDKGLITPTIQNAQNYSLRGLADQSQKLIQKARDNQLSASDLQNGTLTISNLGVIKQVDHFTAVINPPQIAIIAVGTIKKRPVVINDGLFIHHTVWLTVSGDHRFIDGMILGQFLKTFQLQLDSLQV